MMKFLIASIFSCFFLLSATSHAKKKFKVIGYQAAWGSIEHLDYAKLTHINYSFAQPHPDGSLKPLPNPEKLKQIVKQAHQHKVKVGIAVGGWNKGDDSAFEKFASTVEGRAKFIKEVMKLVKTYKLDGVDMDWEYPDQGKSAIHFAALMTELSVELKKEKKFLSTAVVSYGKTGEGISKEVFAHIDMLNIMAYDGKDHGSYEQAVKSIHYWKQRGCPAEKVILGLPFYGRSPYMSYKALLAKDPAAHSKDLVGEIHYNGTAMIQKKTKLALISCGGVMIWELSQDANQLNAKHSLLKAIDEVVK